MPHVTSPRPAPAEKLMQPASALHADAQAETSATLKAAPCGGASEARVGGGGG